MISSEPSLVLGYRDLNVPLNSTITFHRRVIAESKEGCWWGWWARSDETTPCVWLRDLRLPTSVLLYDSFQDLVHEAQCVDILCSESEMLPPEVHLTPHYYSGTRYKAWFKFTDIEDATPEHILLRKCLRSTDSQAELGWVVKDLAALKRDRSTMWLLGDRDR